MNQEKLKWLFTYDQQTGIFYWKNPPGYKMKKGQEAGQKSHKGGYVAIRYNKKLYLAHRLAWLYCTGENPKGVIDHKNGNPRDNRISNLRDVSQLINSQNTLKPHKNNSSGIIGITLTKGKWNARIRVSNRRLHLGCFEKKEDAKQAYLEAKKKYHSYY